MGKLRIGGNVAVVVVALGSAATSVACYTAARTEADRAAQTEARIEDRMRGRLVDMLGHPSQLTVEQAYAVANGVIRTDGRWEESLFAVAETSRQRTDSLRRQIDLLKSLIRLDPGTSDRVATFELIQREQEASDGQPPVQGPKWTPARGPLVR